MDYEIKKHGEECKEEVLAGSLFCYAICSYHKGTKASGKPMPNIICSRHKVREMV